MYVFVKFLFFRKVDQVFIGLWSLNHGANHFFRENLVDDSTTEEQKAKPKELNRSKTIQNAIERQELLEKTFKNEEASESGSVPYIYVTFLLFG